MFENTIEIEKKTEELYAYQQGDIDAILSASTTA
jgi:hypothetical protein